MNDSKVLNMNDSQLQYIKSKVNSSSSFEEKKAAIKEAVKYGGVDRLYAPHRGAFKPVAEPGLANLINNAMTIQEVKNLLMKGELDYKKASPGTVKKWRRIAENRIKELSVV